MGAYRQTDLRCVSASVWGTENVGVERHDPEVITSGDLFAQLDDESLPNAAISTGLTDLDQATGGVARGQLWVNTSYPAQGRTTLLTQIADPGSGATG